jgi:hypothetical protein
MKLLCGGNGLFLMTNFYLLLELLRRGDDNF